MSLSNDEIISYIEQLEKEAKALRQEAIRLSWYMRGGLSVDHAMYLSQSDREFISKLIKENIEITKKSGVPFI